MHQPLTVIQFTLTNSPVGQLGLEVGTGGLVGFVVGFAAKKLLKLAAAIAGIFVAGLTILESEGLIEVRWGTLGELLETTTIGQQTPGLVLEFADLLPVGGSLAVGTAVGFKRG